MTRFRDSNAPEGRVVFGGEVFVDGVTADIEIGAETTLLFKSAGIVSVVEPEPEKPAQKRTK